MLTREIMGVFALGVLWLNTLLVAGAALSRARALATLRRALAPLPSDAPSGQYGLLHGRLVGPSDGGPVALASIEQVGRQAAGKARAILWHDRKRASVVRGGSIDVSGTTLRLGEAEGDLAETWIDDPALVDAGRCPDVGAFDELFPGARKARGVTRTIEASLAAGTEAWVAGRVEGEGDARRLVGSKEAPLVVAAMDPRAWLGRKIALLWLFAPLTLVGAGACTVLALWPPVFDGAASKAGGLACLVYFLLVLPAGTRVRDAVVLPPRRVLRGRWDDPEGRPVAAPASAA